MNVLIEQLESCGVIPVIQIERVDDALPLAEALIEGGLPCAEITFRTPCATQAIRQISAHYPQMLLGAGTVLTPEQAETMVGHAVGGVCPFCVKEGVKVYLDPSLRRFDIVYPACGSPNSAVKLTPEELELLSGGEWCDLCKLPEPAAE